MLAASAPSVKATLHRAGEREMGESQSTLQKILVKLGEPGMTGDGMLLDQVLKLASRQLISLEENVVAKYALGGVQEIERAAIASDGTIAYVAIMWSGDKRVCIGFDGLGRPARTLFTMGEHGLVTSLFFPEGSSDPAVVYTLDEKIWCVRWDSHWTLTFNGPESPGRPVFWFSGQQRYCALRKYEKDGKSTVRIYWQEPGCNSTLIGHYYEEDAELVCHRPITGRMVMLSRGPVVLENRSHDRGRPQRLSYDGKTVVLENTDEHRDYLWGGPWEEEDGTLSFLTRRVRRNRIHPAHGYQMSGSEFEGYYLQTFDGKSKRLPIDAQGSEIDAPNTTYVLTTRNLDHGVTSESTLHDVRTGVTFDLGDFNYQQTRFVATDNTLLVGADIDLMVFNREDGIEIEAYSALGDVTRLRKVGDTLLVAPVRENRRASLQFLNERGRPIGDAYGLLYGELNRRSDDDPFRTLNVTDRGLMDWRFHQGTFTVLLYPYH